MKCSKCGAVSGDDWSQCKGSCPIPGSPHHSSIEEIIAAQERHDFEEWGRSVRLDLHTYQDSPHWPAGTYSDSRTSCAWHAWKARGRAMPKCKGREHPGCNYLGVCGTVCNKCGQTV